MDPLRGSPGQAMDRPSTCRRTQQRSSRSCPEIKRQREPARRHRQLGSGGGAIVPAASASGVSTVTWCEGSGKRRNIAAASAPSTKVRPQSSARAGALEDDGARPRPDGEGHREHHRVEAAVLAAARVGRDVGGVRGRRREEQHLAEGPDDDRRRERPEVAREGHAAETGAGKERPEGERAAVRPVGASRRSAASRGRRSTGSSARRAARTSAARGPRSLDDEERHRGDVLEEDDRRPAGRPRERRESAGRRAPRSRGAGASPSVGAGVAGVVRRVAGGDGRPAAASTAAGRERRRAVDQEEVAERDRREDSADGGPDGHAEVDRETVDGERGLAARRARPSRRRSDIAAGRNASVSIASAIVTTAIDGARLRAPGGTARSMPPERKSDAAHQRHRAPAVGEPPGERADDDRADSVEKEDESGVLRREARARASGRGPGTRGPSSPRG